MRSIHRGTPITPACQSIEFWEHRLVRGPVYVEQPARTSAGDSKKLFRCTIGHPGFNPFSAGTAFMLMQTGWIQASRRVTRPWDPTCLPLSLSFPVKIKQNLKVLKSRRQYNPFLQNYPAFKGLSMQMWQVSCSMIRACVRVIMHSLTLVYYRCVHTHEPCNNYHTKLILLFCRTIIFLNNFSK